MKNIAVIGTGFSGLVLANELKKHSSYEVTFFEKSRGVGGRIATRYNESWEFDHGAPFFDANDADFLKLLQVFIHQGIVSTWNHKIVNSKMVEIDTQKKYFIGTPKMNSIPKILSKGFDIHFDTKITSIQQKNDKWFLKDDKSQEYGTFDVVITSTPPQQAYDILPNECLYRNSLQSYKMLPQFAVLVGLDAIKNNFDVMQVDNLKIEKIVLNHYKNGRTNKPSIVVYSSLKWASENINIEKNQVGKELLNEVENLLDIKLQPQMVQIHRWLYSKPEFKSNLLFLSDDGILSCGDWLSSGTIEGAFLSGNKLAKHILDKQ